MSNEEYRFYLPEIGEKLDILNSVINVKTNVRFVNGIKFQCQNHQTVISCIGFE